MNIVNSPMLFNHILSSQHHLDGIYEAMKTNDMAGCVMRALHVLRSTDTLPRIANHKKNTEQSDLFRNKGNLLFGLREYKKTLQYYNTALQYAPMNSAELVKAYGNRSALLFKLEAYGACLQDIEVCFKLQCPEELLQKLKKRKLQCQMMLWKDGLKDSIMRCPFSEEFFKFNRERHPDIPCLSADVQVTTESAETKIYAAKDIPTGTILAIETAFTTHSYNDKSDLTCYYCQKMSLNLFPCDKCCHALFCSKKCQELCVNEYHSTECHIMSLLNSINDSFQFRLAVKTVLKLKTQCKRWSTLIKESQSIGSERLRNSSASEIYDVRNPSSMLSFNANRNFVHGTIYNSSFVFATVIHYLQLIDGFFPSDQRECLEAQKCIAKLFMTLDNLWPCSTEIDNAAEELPGSDLVSNFVCHYGWFGFASKLKHFCEPNVLVLGLDNKVALVTVESIKKNAELKISQIGHWYENVYESKRSLKLYQTIRNVCTCRVCKGAWSLDNFFPSNLTLKQKKALQAWRSMKENLLAQREVSYFKETCKTLTLLQDKVQTKEHHAVFRELYVQFRLCQHVITGNVNINC